MLEKTWKKAGKKSRNSHFHLDPKGSSWGDSSVDPELWDHKLSRKSGAGITQGIPREINQEIQKLSKNPRNCPGIPGAEIIQSFRSRDHPGIPGTKIIQEFLEQGSPRNSRSRNLPGISGAEPRNPTRNSMERNQGQISRADP